MKEKQCYNYNNLLRMMKGWNGEISKWWNDGVMEWCNGEMVKWWNGSMVKLTQNGEMVISWNGDIVISCGSILLGQTCDTEHFLTFYKHLENIRGYIIADTHDPKTQLETLTK